MAAYHLGLTLASLPFALLILPFAGHWASLATIALFNLLGLYRWRGSVLVSFSALKALQSISGRFQHSAERMVTALASEKALRTHRNRVIPGDRILLLLPHCLQNSGCVHRITFSVENCVRCGGCPIGALSELAERTGVRMAVATGGTLARRHVRENAPLAVIAVACPRDLGQGILDAWPVPVIGVENSRPFGDCVNTAVDVNRIALLINELTQTR
jgi:uncharacterized protein